MDIMTLNAVIANLKEKVVRHREMLKWSSDNNDEKAVSMWCNTIVECKENIQMVEKMLNEELAFRAEEAA